MNPRDNLSVKAATLAKLSPQAWSDFLEALAVYNEVHRENLVKSPLPELAVNQGRAQALSSLIGILTACKENADKIARKEQ